MQRVLQIDPDFSLTGSSETKEKKVSGSVPSPSFWCFKINTLIIIINLSYRLIIFMCWVLLQAVFMPFWYTLLIYYLRTNRHISMQNNYDVDAWLHRDCLQQHQDDNSRYTAISFIHSDNFYSASSSPLLLRSAPDTARIPCRSFLPKRHRQLPVKDLPKVPTWRLERDSNPRPFGSKISTQPIRHHV